MTVIDLGEVTHQDAGPSIPVNYRRVLRVLLAALTVVGVLAVAGSAHGTRPGLRTLWITPYSQDTIALDARTVYVAQAGDDGQQSLAAYDLATGARRWSAAVQPSEFASRPAGDTVLVPTDTITVTHEEPNGDTYYYITAGTTIALDAATGAERWRVKGDASPLPAGTALVTEHDWRNRVVGLRLLALHDGAERWKLALPPLAGFTLLPGPEHPEAVATVGEDGTAAIYGFADGKVRATGRVPWDATAALTVSLIPAGRGFAVVRAQPDGGSLTTVYSADTLRPLWQAGSVTSCGELICSTGLGGVAGHDPATGRVVWTLPDTFDGWAISPDRMVTLANGDNTEFQLVDSRTGKRLGEPIAGMLASSSNVAGVPPTGNTDGTMLATRPSRDPAGQLVVSRIDLADGAQTPLGRFGPSGEQALCFTSPGYLACPRYDGLHIMAVRSRDGG
ncbi:outer membrane protein assembly factor BamB family protein [Paractinoplanes globisporus]|uniref:PQQ-binding-like beta-propeller repeat protein n=1 Tax=Paractinoplanes globisporus TaxID=113565 RepID=A0ABW6WN70_9ACTN|nr:PQQ-binding-like beta-propeller repeat protein [Actinoplanes globisporus]